MASGRVPINISIFFIGLSGIQIVNNNNPTGIIPEYILLVSERRGLQKTSLF